MPRRAPAKQRKPSAPNKKTLSTCRYVTPAGRHCRRPRREPLAVCSAHRQHDPKFVAIDLAKAARRIMWTQNPDDICKKLVSFAQHGRIPPDLAEKMIYTAFVLADNNAKTEIDIWSRNIAQCARADADHAPALVVPDPARLAELRRVLAQFGAATEEDEPEANAPIEATEPKASAAPQAPPQNEAAPSRSDTNDQQTTSPAGPQTTDNSAKS